MPGNPLLPSVVRAECVPDGAAGGARWDYLTYQGLREREAEDPADPELDPLFGINVSTPVDSWRRNTCTDAEAPLVALPDRITLYVMTPRPAVSTNTTIELAVFLGFDTDGEQAIRVSLQLTPTTASSRVLKVAQIGGQSFQAAQVYGRIVPGGVERLSLTMRVMMAQAGGPYQLNWGGGGKLEYPLAAHTLP